MREALTSFKNVYNMSDNKINPVAFLIKAFDDRNYTNSERCENGNSFYYFKVKDKHLRRIFSDFKSVAGYNNGDTVKISFDVDLEEVIDL
jgi:hypothetical protein